MLGTHIAEADTAADLAAVHSWMAAQQFTSDASADGYGAIRWHHTVSYYGTDGKAYYKVVPYYSSLAVSHYVRSGGPNALDYAERWISWYLAAPRSTGAMYDWWYTAGGHDGTTSPPGCSCANYDSDDSYAATFLGAVSSYFDAGGARAVSFLGGHELDIQRIADRIVALQQSDGLTWAKSSWHIKYLEDNSEVYWGLKAAAHIESAEYANGAKSSYYDGRADQVGGGVYTTLFDHSVCRYRWADGAGYTVNPATWDPDNIASVWPVLFGLIPGTHPVSLTVMTSIHQNFAWTNHLENGRVWPAMTVAAQWSAATTDASASAAYIKSVEYPSGYTPSAFPWVFTVADGGWLALYLAGVADSGLPSPRHPLPACGNPGVPVTTGLSCTQPTLYSPVVNCAASGTDPDGDSMRFATNWGDGTTTTTAAIANPATATLTHTQAIEGLLTITTRGADVALPSWTGNTLGASVVVDLNPPTLAMADPAPGKLYAGCTSSANPGGGTVQAAKGCLRFSAGDAVSGLAAVAISAPGACAGALPATVSGPGPWSFEYALCGHGSGAAPLTATDNAGHTTSVSRAVTYAGT